MTKRLVLLAALLLIPLAWWFGGPFLAVHGLADAIERRDTARLPRYVDFPRVRASLRAQVSDVLARQMTRHVGADTAGGLLGSWLYGLGGQLGGTAVDTLVTPTGIAALLQGHVLYRRGRNELQGGDAWAPTEPARPLKDARHRFERLDRFVVEIDRGPGAPPLQFVLEPQGLRWRVVDLRNALLP